MSLSLRNCRLRAAQWLGAAFACFCLAGLAVGQDGPGASGQAAKEVTFNQADLEELETYRNALADYADNEFQHEQKTAEYLQAVSALPGSKLEWTAAVTRVKRDRVILEHAQWGRTRVVLVHYSEQGAPTFGSLTLPSLGCVPPTTHRYARHAGTPTLEMGLEIKEELAKTLRAGDLVQLSGYIEHAHTRLFRGNSPDTLIYVANIQARKYYTPEELDLLEEQAMEAARAANAVESKPPVQIVEEKQLNAADGDAEPKGDDEAK